MRVDLRMEGSAWGSDHVGEGNAAALGDGIGAAEEEAVIILGEGLNAELAGFVATSELEAVAARVSWGGSLLTGIRRGLAGAESTSSGSGSSKLRSSVRLLFRR